MTGGHFVDQVSRPDHKIQDTFEGFGFGKGHTDCARCGRKLVAPRSRQVGLGPTCLKKAKNESEAT